MALPSSYWHVATEEMQDCSSSLGQQLEGHNMEKQHADMAKNLDTVLLEPVGKYGELVVQLLKIQIPD